METETQECFACHVVVHVDDLSICGGCSNAYCDVCAGDENAVTCACPPQVYVCLMCGKRELVKNHSLFHNECMKCSTLTCLDCPPICMCDVDKTLAGMEGN
jgi:hypothetical protein